MNRTRISCSYDWAENSNDTKLECQVHPGMHHAVFVMPSVKDSTLSDMLGLEILQGTAKIDAENLASDEAWLAG